MSSSDSKRLGPDSPFTLYQRINELNARLVEAEKWANTMEHERDWERQVVHSELLLRAETAEARLAKVPPLVEKAWPMARLPFPVSADERDQWRVHQQELLDVLTTWEQE